MKLIDLSFYKLVFESEAFQQSIELSKLIARIASLFYSIHAMIAEGWCHACCKKRKLKLCQWLSSFKLEIPVVVVLEWYQ